MSMTAPLIALAQQNPPPEAAYGLTTGGWLLMTASVSFMTGLLGWCIYKVITTPGSTERVHSQANIEPPDQER